MSFVDPVFFIFLFTVFTVFHLLNHVFSNGREAVPFAAVFFLAAASVFFYGYFRPVYIFLLAGSSLTAWIFGGILGGDFLQGSAFLRNRISRNGILFFGISGLLFPLFYFKYSLFFLNNIQAAGFFTDVKTSAILLPLGISFFTFQNISYVTDVFRGVISAEKNLLRYSLYISFFPQLVAGPIVTAREFLPRLFRKIQFSELDLRSAFFYLISGYIKKAVFADRLAVFSDPVFKNPESFGWIGIVSAVLAYSFQIYFDFSGYSDIAIGVGHLFGFKLPENFNFPYGSPGIRQFWRRWHMTLSIWLRDHIYIPLGGSRQGYLRMYFSLIATMLLGGLWHGAHWNFVIWGFFHGLFLVLDRYVPERFSKIPVIRQIYIFLTFAVTSLLWVLFRAASERNGFDTAMSMYGILFALKDGPYAEKGIKFILQTVILIISMNYLYEKIFRYFKKASDFTAAAALAVTVILIVVFAPRSSSFIYFVF